MKVTIPREIFKKFLDSNLKIVVGDANIFIPTDRDGRSFPFSFHKEVFLDPFIEACSLVYVHKKVLEEVMTTEINSYIKTNKNIIVVDEDEMGQLEQYSFKTIEDAVANYTNYNPNNGCFEDEGEVKSISYAAVNDIDFFVTHDKDAINILENRNLQKFTRDVRAITIYEIIYLLSKKAESKKKLRMMYRFLYRLTPKEKRTNPEWAEFIKQCDDCY